MNNNICFNSQFPRQPWQAGSRR